MSIEPLPEMSIEPSPQLVNPASAVYDWAQGDARAKVPSGQFTNHVGKNDCRRFLYSLVSRTDGFQLPIQYIHVPGSNTEIDAFLEWSGLEWSQLKDHSSPFFEWEDGAGRASQRVINQVGKNDCRRFLDSFIPRHDQLKLPFTAKHTHGNNTELDSFLSWSGLSWDQLKHQSAQWKTFSRVLKPFDPKKYKHLLLRLHLETLVQGAWDRMLVSVPAQQKIAGPAVVASINWLRGRRQLNNILEKHLANLGECFMMCLTDDPKRVDDAELEYTESHVNYCNIFIRDPEVLRYFSATFLGSFFPGDEWGLENVAGSLPGYLDDCIFKEFNERVFNLDRPDILTELIQPVSMGRSGRVVAYVSGWLVHRAFKRFRLNLAEQCADPDDALQSFSSWHSLNKVDPVTCRDSCVPVSLLRQRCRGHSTFPSFLFFEFCCVVETYLVKRLSIENMRFLGGLLMVRMRKELGVCEEVRDAFKATLPSDAHSSDLMSILFPDLIHGYCRMRGYDFAKAIHARSPPNRPHPTSAICFPSFLVLPPCSWAF